MMVSSGAEESGKRPIGITILIVFFAVSAVISLTASISLFAPGSFLEPMWRLNPRGQEGLRQLGIAGPVLLAVVSAACALASLGLKRRDRRGYFLAIAILSVNLLGDVINVVSGMEPRAIVGVPIAAAVILYLVSRRVRNYFV